jgi:signal transduction histidine kinase
MVDDITERRAREAERARVTERLRLGEIELRAALDEAESASRLKSEFLARITHEFRTPLNGILGGVALIRSTDDAETRARWLDIVEESARALQRVIDDVLDIAQIEAGAEMLDIRDFDPAALVSRLTEEARAAAQQRGLILRCIVLDATPARWRGDPRRLGRVIGALLDNAIKFTAEGMISVRVGGGPALLRVEVADTGPGVPASEQAAIFERFRQVDGSTTRQHGGVGLGLSIAREFTQMMGGRIGVRSAPGNGATFWIEFDAASRSSDPGEPIASLARTAEPSR